MASHESLIYESLQRIEIQNQDRISLERKQIDLLADIKGLLERAGTPLFKIELNSTQVSVEPEGKATITKKVKAKELSEPKP